MNFTVITVIPLYFNASSVYLYCYATVIYCYYCYRQKISYFRKPLINKEITVITVITVNSLITVITVNYTYNKEKNGW